MLIFHLQGDLYLEGPLPLASHKLVISGVIADLSRFDVATYQGSYTSV